MAVAVRGVSLRIAYQFDGSKLHPIHLSEPFAML
jgi:hypothetical protein